MSAKARRLIIIYTAAALIALGTVAAVSHARLEDYRMTARYSSERAFEAAVSAADGLSRDCALYKLIVFWQISGNNYTKSHNCSN